MAYLSMPHPDVYTRAIRSSADVTYTIDATLGGTTLATGLQPTGGTATDTTKPGVRRQLNLELAPEPGLYDLLKADGTLLTATSHVTLTGNTTIDIPMGVFDIDQKTLRDAGGGLSLTAPDKWQKIVRAKFLWPTGPQVGIPVTDQIVALIRDALGSSEPVIVSATSTSTVGPLTWQQDRAQAIIDLATSIGAWVYFDRNGVATIADVPTIGASADWLIDSSASGVLIGLDRSESRTSTYNVVVVSSSAASGALFPTQYVWDSDPASPTYAGTNPPFATAVGPFGIVPYFHDDPIIPDTGAAQNAGLAILSRTVGLASQASMGSVPNPAMDAFDVLDVLPSRERYDIPRVLERHAADTITHPLVQDGDPGTPQQIQGRSTRSDPYT